MLPNSNSKLPNIEVAELAVWGDGTRAYCVLQANSCWPIKVELAWESTQRCPSTLMSFCKFSNYTGWWWCVKVKTVHSIWCQGMFLMWLTLCFYRTELNAPLPPLAAHVATPNGTHQESMSKTDQPPCQLMRPRRINNRVETDTYFSLYWLYNDKCIILCLNVVANTLQC